MQKYTLYNGDCLEYMKKIKTSSVDLIVTDPPYNLGKFMENRDTNLGKMRDNFFGIAGWDDLDFKEWKQSMDLGQVMCLHYHQKQKDTIVCILK